MKNDYNKVLGFKDIYLFSLGNILGAGIFVLMSKSTGMSGSWTWLSFLIAGILNLFSGWSFYYLSKSYLNKEKTNNIEYESVLEALGDKMATFVSFLTIITTILVSTTILSGSADYLSKIINLKPNNLKIIIIGIITLFNCCNIKHTRLLNNITGAYELSILIIIIIIGLLFTGDSNRLKDLYDTDKFSGKGVAMATYLTMFTYLGYESSLKFSRETKNAEKNIPKAILYSIVTSIIVYILVFISSYKILGVKGLSNSTAPIADVIGKITGNKYLLSIVALLSGIAITNGIMITNSSGSRLLQDLGERFNIPLVKSINKDTHTPIYATLIIASLVLLGSINMNITRSAILSNFTAFIILAFINYSAYKKLSKDIEDDNKFIKRGASGLGFITSIVMLIYILK